ncbi:hypothetical protein BGZ80_001171 [Entomortierella chlamydospora]|uniref:Uncharacterized protein n=1 Tax=Entomortierella chlamydospora TaxID=101097 RepID=A0A9P6MRF8_9FUNG|nr:hypothetical protein BGZ79_009473 [Entomortierella chlamydospora]KAG0010810.1 hypothetical protein BGZ80_001171 [Entomortierella chlamydospora]
MTQHVNPRDSSAHTGQVEPLSTFVFGGHAGSGTSSAGSVVDRWPFLLNIRQAAITLFQESAAATKPHREKLHVIALRLWQVYLGYANDYPLWTFFLSSIALLSAGPIIGFLCVTGVSLAILISTATVIVVAIQSIVVGIAGAILLFILGAIVIFTIIGSICVVAGYTGFKLARDIAVVVHGHHQQHVKRQQQQQQPQQQLHTQGEHEKTKDS